MIECILERVERGADVADIENIVEKSRAFRQLRISRS